jgi:protein involved in polysaccharide export with SLBB domain
MALRLAATAALVLLALPTVAGAQSQSLYRSRAFLDSSATAAERAGHRDEAESIRERLRVGDFYPGDKVYIELFGGEEPIRDTLSVRTGQELVVGTLPPFSLKGLLRAELDSALTAQARRSLQRPIVRAQPQLRLMVTGAVGRPGFVTVRGDAAVADVVNAVGGLTAVAQIQRSTVKRNGEKHILADSLGTLFRVGATLDQADFRAGDEMVIGEKRQANWTNLLWATSAGLGVVISVISLTRGR